MARSPCTASPARERSFICTSRSWKAPQPAGTQAAPPPTKGNGQHILYLDDEDALVLLARRLLERLGYQASGFTSAAEALAAFEAAPDQFDLVLSDLVDARHHRHRRRPTRARNPPRNAGAARLRLRARRRTSTSRAQSACSEVIWKPTTINEMGELLRRVLAKIIPRS